MKNISYAEKLKELVESSTIHGIPNALRTNSIIMRVFWLIIFLIFFAFSIHSTVTIIIKYLEYDVIVKMEIMQAFQSDFPTVTFCNINPIDYSIEKNYENVSKFLNESFLFNQNFSSKYCDKQMDIVLSQKFHDLKGFSFDKMMISCKYDDKPCNLNNFYYINSHFFGNCFSFNYGKNMTGHEISVLKSKRPGMVNGLRLKLFIGAPEYQPCWGSKFGAIIVIHNKTVPPLFIEEGLFVQAGAETNLVINKVSINKLSKPHSDCVTNVESIDGFDSDSYRETIKKDGYYRQKWCISYCAVNKIRQENSKICLSPNSIGLNLIDCINNLENLTYYYEDCSKECPIECEYSFFNLFSNIASFPSYAYSSFLLENDAFKSKFPYKNISYEQIKQSVVSLNIYYNSIDYQQISEVPETDFGSMLGNLGGQLGLFLGVSCMSFMEIFEILFHIFDIFYQKKFKKTKVENLK